MIPFDQPNVLIDHNGHARLTDFGFTSVVRGVNSVLVTEVQGYSTRWAAPEVLGNGDRKTREADIFALGMIVIEVSKCAPASSVWYEGWIVYLTSTSYLRSLPGGTRSANSQRRSLFRRFCQVNGRIVRRTQV